MPTGVYLRTNETRAKISQKSKAWWSDSIKRNKASEAGIARWKKQKKNKSKNITSKILNFHPLKANEDYLVYFKKAAEKSKDYSSLLKYFNLTTGFNSKMLSNCHLGKSKTEMELDYKKSFNPIFKKQCH